MFMLSNYFTDNGYKMPHVTLCFYWHQRTNDIVYFDSLQKRLSLSICLAHSLCLLVAAAIAYATISSHIRAIYIRMHVNKANVAKRSWRIGESNCSTSQNIKGKKEKKQRKKYKINFQFSSFFGDYPGVHIYTNTAHPKSFERSRSTKLNFHLV